MGTNFYLATTDKEARDEYFEETDRIYPRDNKH